MSKQSLVIGILLLTLTIASCQKDLVAPDTNSNPNTVCANNTGWLANGHQLVYVNTPLFILADTLYTSFAEVSPGIFASTSKFDDGAIYPTQNIFIQACNNSIYQAATQNMLNKQEVYRINGNVGDSWTFTAVSAGGNNITTTTTITGLNVSKTVPAGTFVCTKFRQVSVSSGGTSISADTYVNNAVGPVLVEGSTVHYELARKNF